jgi:hypothetical protein
MNMGNTKMIDIKAWEVIHLFDVMKKYEVTCNLEFNTGESSVSLIGISDMPVNVEYFEGNVDGDSIIVKLGDADFSFDLKNHFFSKDVTGCQINICIAGKSYVAWFNSNVIPAEGIEEANNYLSVDQLADKLEFTFVDGDPDNSSSLPALLKNLTNGYRVKHLVEGTLPGSYAVSIVRDCKDPDHADA